MYIYHALIDVLSAHMIHMNINTIFYSPDLNHRILFDDLNQVVLNRALASSVGVKDGTLTSRAVTLVHPKTVFLGNKL